MMKALHGRSAGMQTYTEVPLLDRDAVPITPAAPMSH